MPAKKKRSRKGARPDSERKAGRILEPDEATGEGSGSGSAGGAGISDMRDPLEPPERTIMVPKIYIFGLIAAVVVAGFAIWFFFMRANPYLPVAGTYCGVQTGTSYCYELKDNGTYTLHVKKEGTDQETTFDSKYGVDGDKITLDSPNEQIGIRTVFTLQDDRLCTDTDCLFTKQ